MYCVVCSLHTFTHKCIHSWGMQEGYVQIRLYLSSSLHFLWIIKMKPEYNQQCLFFFFLMYLNGNGNQHGDVNLVTFHFDESRKGYTQINALQVLGRLLVNQTLTYFIILSSILSRVLPVWCKDIGQRSSSPEVCWLVYWWLWILPGHCPVSSYQLNILQYGIQHQWTK